MPDAPHDKLVIHPFGRPCREDEYDDQRHVYINCDTGEEVPSVSRICQPPAPETEAVLAGSARGSAVHDMARAMFEDMPIPDYPEFDGYLSALDDWRLSYLPLKKPTHILCVEEPWISRAGFGGTADLVVMSKGCKVHIFDFKTSRPAPWHQQQLAGYALLYSSVPYRTETIDVYLTPDGAWTIRERHDMDGFAGFSEKAREHGVRV